MSIHLSEPLWVNISRGYSLIMDNFFCLIDVRCMEAGWRSQKDCDSSWQSHKKKKKLFSHACRCVEQFILQRLWNFSLLARKLGLYELLPYESIVFFLHVCTHLYKFQHIQTTIRCLVRNSIQNQVHFVIYRRSSKYIFFNKTSSHYN